ncbi:RNA helicase [Actinoplanes sp. SE50]|uniref:DEAD/DEAH box helicase n=1 Tax=unclassified Actinoplanes TaxID=2626549 RepID=UPI00023EC01E|nr:DEAD/DEAH box helicase domain-containing protein [Actinoplanes sp. SE50/110]ATO79718.1 RNA helicase [Actinoplanes sp. SE50]SLL97121.1 RNA helicase [Actinoplanes sp. SE50/110]
MTTFADPSTFPSVFESNSTETTEAVDTATAPAAEQEQSAAAAEQEQAAAATEQEQATEPATAEQAAAEPAAIAEEQAAEQAEEPAAEQAPVLTFADLGLPAEIVRVLTREGITTPFEIQAATVPDALAGRDVLGRGQTGSGKTLAFGLPVLARTAQGGKARPHHPKALILVPTRELAMQVADSLMPVGRAVGVFLKTAVGGVPYDRQMDALRRGVEVIVATPGRLADLIERGACKLDDVEITVLDEADQMADMGFLPEVTDLLSKTPENAQRLLFSATLDGDVDALVQRFMHDPVTHSTAPAEASVSTMDHHLLLIPPAEKFPITSWIANRAGKTIVFARTQMGVDRLVEQLHAVGVRAGALHGGKTQRVRTRTLAEFKEGRTNVLVATDVAARGIHVDGVSLVVHVDPPKDPKDYLHRAGRTARAGESGAVVTLVLPKQRRTTQQMMAKAGVSPAEVRVRIGDEKLAAITGAQEPSGVPVVEEPEPRRERSGGGRRFGGGDRGDRPRYGDRPQRSYGDRNDRFGDRPAGGGYRGDRPTGGGYRGDRPADGGYRGDRPAEGGYRGDRPADGGYRGDRPNRERGGFGDRTDRPAADRGGFNDRDRPRADRPFGERTDRHFADRPARTGDRPSGQRRDGQRIDRREGGPGRFNSSRPARSH